MPLLLLSGCSSLHDFFGSAPNKREPEIVVPLEERPVEAPISANHFVLDSPDQAVVGVPQVVYTTSNDTLSDLARAYGLSPAGEADPRHGASKSMESEHA